MAAPSPTSAFRQRLAWIVALLLGLSSAWFATMPLRAHANWMNYVQDDFFYYFKVALNLASGHGSTFNGIAPTNGYHPLWMVTLAALAKLSGSAHVFGFLAFSIWAATLAVFFLGWRILRLAGADTLSAATLSILLAVYSAHLFHYGMEVTLATPLALLVAWLLLRQDYLRPPHLLRSSELLGLAIAAMVLARLDTALFALLLLFFLLRERSILTQLHVPQWIGLAMGLGPLILYFLSNQYFFHTWMPVSGAAKALKLTTGFSPEPWRSLFGKDASQLIMLLPIVLAIAILVLRWRSFAPTLRAVAAAMLLFPWLHIAALSWQSDWQLWGWYFYPLRVALCGSFLVFAAMPRVQHILLLKPVTALLLFVALLDLKRQTWFEQQPDIVRSASDLARFAATHPGTYAMGDRSGAAGVLLNQPIVQLEGLMMDKPYLQYLRQQAPLTTVFAHYQIRYYVWTTEKPFTGCTDTAEPAKGGPHSAKMRGNFCNPLAVFHHNETYTYVFGV